MFETFVLVALNPGRNSRRKDCKTDERGADHLKHAFDHGHVYKESVRDDDCINIIREHLMHSRQDAAH